MKRFRNEHGQTLVETVVGIFVLTIGISTALGLAVSMFNASSSAVKQVIGAGLAREGVEAAFNMRGTNWLKGQLSTTCYNYTDITAFDAYCHQDWLKPLSQSTGLLIAGGYDISVAGSYKLDLNTAADETQQYWTLTAAGGSPDYRLYYDANASTGVLYKTTSGSAVASDYFREIVLAMQTPAPYAVGQPSLGPRVKVTSRVWWNDKGCPGAATWATTSPKCRIELVTYMTNWRNY